MGTVTLRRNCPLTWRTDTKRPPPSWHSLPPRGAFLTAPGPRGSVYLTAPCGPIYVDGQPVRVLHLCLGNACEPEWCELDPRDVRFSIREFRRIRAGLRNRADRGQRTGRSNSTRPELSARDLRALRELFEPDWRLVERLPMRTQYPLAWFAQRSDGFRDLVRSAPMIACMAVFHGSSWRTMDLDDFCVAVAEMSFMPRASIVEAAGFPGESARAFSRVTPSAADHRYLPELRWALEERSTLRAFQHLPAIGPDLIRIIGRPSLMSLVSGRFLELADRFDSRARRASLVPMLEDALKLFDAGVARRRYFSSPATLADWWHRATAHTSVEDMASLLRVDFPPPPLQGVPGVIEPIDNGRKLVHAALKHSNCIAGKTYVQHLVRGECFAYIVTGRFGTAPAIFTICATDHAAGGGPAYYLEELEFRRDAHPGAIAATRTVLREWFADSQQPVVACVLSGNPPGRQLSLFEDG